MARVVASVALLFIFALFAGCLGEDEDLRPFASLGAPDWEAGFSWTWAATRSGSWSYASEDGSGTSSGETSTRLEHRVVNTEVPLHGKPVYWLRADQELDAEGPGGAGPFGEEGLQAVAQSDLQPVARFYEHKASMNGCEETMVRGYPIDPFPLLRFPLEQGAHWEQEVEEHVTMRAVVQGATEVVVPAGSFDAVEVELRVHIDPAFYAEDEGHEELRSFESTTRVWYAESVRNIVRLESEMRSHMVEEGEGEVEYFAETLLELDRFSLAADVEEALPTIIDMRDPSSSMVPVPYRGMQIVSDTVFPLNAANTSLEVTFGLSYGSLTPNDAAPGIAVVDEVPTDPWYDEENQTLKWTFYSGDETFTATGVAPQVTLPPGGAFDVTVRLVSTSIAVETDTSCMTADEDRPLRHHASLVDLGPWITTGRFTVEWRQPFQVTHSGSGEAAYPLFDVPLLEDNEVVVHFDVTHPGLVQDAPALVFDLGGEQVRFERDARQHIAGSGDARVVWDAQSNDLLQAAGLTFGHSAEGWVHVRY